MTKKWTHYQNDEDVFFIVEADEQQKDIAVVVWQEDGGHETNYQLLAAAPELLEALENFIYHSTGMEHMADRKHRLDWTAELWEIRDRANQIVAKAKGE